VTTPASTTPPRYSGRPSPWWIIFAWPVSLLVPFLIAYAVKLTLETAKLPDAAAWAMKVGWGVLALGLVWRVLEWFSRRYTITDRDVIVRAGVLTRHGADLPLRNIQHVTLHQGLIEQVLGIGSIGIATAGSDGPVVYLVMVAKPKVVLETLRAAVENSESLPTSRRREPVPRPVVIGLAGGIGAGKSAVAGAFARLGALVIDSDKEAKDALDRPEVRGELIRWWGDSILGPEGRVDRKKVGSIIFADAEQRQRLERLVHPLVRATRAEMIARADPRRTPAVVVDAPLLFEAGLEKECDVVVFVDAPRDQRLARVKASRGWDEAELERREKAQIPLEEKRRRADLLIVNDSNQQSLQTRADAAFSQILSMRPRNPAPG
jgi:dephospho-CoA kinase